MYLVAICDKDARAHGGAPHLSLTVTEYGACAFTFIFWDGTTAQYDVGKGDSAGLYHLSLATPTYLRPLI